MQCEELFDPNSYASRLIHRTAEQLVGRAGFSKSDLEDVEQDLRLELWERLQNFDPERAKLTTFVRRVIEKKVAKILRARVAEKRDFRRNSCSLSETLEAEDGAPVERAQTVAQQAHDRRLARSALPEDEEVQLRLDVETVLAELPARERDICERLMSGTITEVSEETGIPRGTLYDLLVRLRERFEAAGLRDYLRESRRRIA